MKSSASVCLIDSPLPLEFSSCRVFRSQSLWIVIGDYAEIIKEIQRLHVTRYHFFHLAKNALFPLTDYASADCRIEYGAIVRSGVKLGKNAVILMGAVVNVGAEIGENTMIDMNAVIGSNARIGKNCHIGAGAVVAGTMEPHSDRPVIIKDQAFIGANSVILEGISIGKNAIVGAGSVVTRDVPDSTVVFGNPARIRRMTQENDVNQIDEELR